MDLDRYIIDHEPAWAELTGLTQRARRRTGRRRLSRHEIERLVQLYQRTSTHLSYCRSTFGDISLTRRLTMIVGDARAAVYGPGDQARNEVSRFFSVTFPGRVWETRRFVVIAAFLTFAPALYVGTWLTNSDAAIEDQAPDYVREAYINDDFESYYSSAPAAQFSTEVLVNNIQVSFFAYAAGILACVGTAVILILNGLALGEAAGLFHAAGQASKFWGLILPHGLLELSAIVIAGGAGLRIGWAIIAPDDHARGTAVAEAGRRSVPIILGLILVFIVAGLIEGFVTPSNLPTWGRVGVGVLAEMAFLTYIVGFGRLAEVGDAGAIRS